MTDVLGDFLNKNSKQAQEYREIIEEMLSGGRYLYAESTLVSFLDFIDENKYITPGQVAAVENIKDQPSRNAY